MCEETDIEIADRDEGLIRRVWRGSRKWTPITDQLTGKVRAPFAAFEPRTADEALSVNVESSVRAAGLDPATLDINPDKQYAARITVGDCHDNALKVFLDPLPENMHHGVVRGLVEMRATDSDRYEKAVDALAKASCIVAARGAAS